MVVAPEIEAEVFRVLTRPYWNSWWATNTVAWPLPPFKRSDFAFLASSIENDQVVGLVGARQTGKTTMVMQLIEQKLETGVDPRRILYSELDEEALQIACGPERLLLDVLEVYQNRILGEDLWNVKEPIFIFLDEVQAIPNWAETLKGMQPNKAVKLLVTGSASFEISRRGHETLPGRLSTHEVYPLKFADAFRLKKKLQDNQEFPAVELWRHELRQALVESLKTRSSEFFAKRMTDCLVALSDMQATLKMAAEEYLKRGGYPKPVLTAENMDAQRLLEGYAADVIMKDLTPWYKVRDHQVARKLLYLLAKSNARELNVNSLLKRLRNSNFPTVDKYLDAFEQTAIISRVENWSKSKLGSTKHPKVYFNDCGMRNALLGQFGVPLGDEEMGFLAETSVLDHLRRLAFKLNAGAKGNVFFDRNVGETDFVLKLTQLQTVLPVEVKYRHQSSPKSTQAHRELVRKEKAPFGISITQDMTGTSGEIINMPLWMFLMLC